ncbi:MAG: hypothetical protein ACXABO_16900 [Promethearchaeota archaeon]|jgi:Ca2+/Na+ antiporter
MPNKKDYRGLNIVSKVISNIRQIFFYLILVVVIIIFVFDQIIGIWLAGSFFIIYLVSYLITLSSKRRLLRIMQEYAIINDNEIADKLERPIDYVRKVLSSLSKNQRKRKWLIVFLNKRYIFLNSHGVESFKQLYNQGYSEKKILESLQQEMNIKTRAEVKAIEITLESNERLNN